MRPRREGDPRRSQRSLSGRRVLVTGAAGFLGFHLIRRLVTEGAAVSAVVRMTPHGRTKRWAADVEKAMTFCRADLTDRAALEVVIQRVRPEYVFHLAGRVDLTRAADVAEACLNENVLATANLLWSLRGMPLNAVVFTSTTEVYGHNPVPYHEEQLIDPPSPYAISKMAAEHYCRFFANAYGLPTRILRLSSVYGPGQSEARLIPSTILAIVRRSSLPVTSGEHRRDFLYVDDAVDGIMRAARALVAPGEIINVGSDRAVSVREVLQTICRLMKTSWTPVYGGLADRINEPPVAATRWDKAKRLLGWEPTTALEDGLRATIAAYRQRSSARRRLALASEPVSA